MNSILTDHSWFQVHKDGSRYMFPGSCLTEEGIERIVPTTYSLITGHLTIWLDPVFKAVELPAGIAYLATSLAHVDRDTLTLKIEIDFSVWCIGGTT